MATVNELSERLKDYLSIITKPSKGQDMYICPICGSGTGNNRTGAFHAPGNTWYCHREQIGGNIFTLHAILNNLDLSSQFMEVAQGVAETLGTTIEESGSRTVSGRTKKKKKAVNVDWLQFVAKGAEQLPESAAYKELRRRSFTDETIKAFNLGYNPKKTIKIEGKNGEKDQYLTVETIIIPYPGTDYYTERILNPPPGVSKYRKPYLGKKAQAPIFKIHSGNTDNYIFIEGELDALSLIQAGAKNVIACMKKDVIREAIESGELKIDGAVIFKDRDNAGTDQSDNVEEVFEKFEISYVIASTPEGFKDANEMLQSDPEQLRAILAEAGKALQAEAEKARQEYLQDNALIRLDSFLQDLDEGRRDRPISTGYELLDKQLDGGLFPGLYILGAVSSLGKTTYALQMADQIAQGGTDVLYFSLEMNARSLISRSLSRLTYQHSGSSKYSAKSSRAITTMDRKNLSDREQALFNKCLEIYSGYASRLFIYEGDGYLGVKEIRKKAEIHKKIMNRDSVIFVDYLQILNPSDPKATDKRNTDMAILELSILSRDLNVPVFVISSFNRSSYSVPVSMSAFKESGSIEYGSNGLFAIQPQGMRNVTNQDDKEANLDLTDTTGESDLRKIELVILKNRDGRKGARIGYNYHAVYNFMEEDPDYKPKKKGSDPKPKRSQKPVQVNGKKSDQEEPDPDAEVIYM